MVDAQAGLILIYPINKTSFTAKLIILLLLTYNFVIAEYAKDMQWWEITWYSRSSWDMTAPQENIPYSQNIDWLQSLKQFFINMAYNILVASLTLMALF